MDRSDAENLRGVSNDASGGGNTVQSGAIHGGVHFHQAPAAQDRVIPRQLPAAAPHFVNRSVEQDALTTLLNGAKTEGVVLISTIDGIAGVGKSTLAVHWAHQMREHFPDGELYANLRGFDPAAEPMRPYDALGTFLSSLDIQPERLPDDLDARAALYRSVLREKRALIVLDNAHSAGQVRPLLPSGPSCLVLVTSRNRLDDLVFREGASRMTLTVLSASESRDLLARYFGQNRLDAEPDAVRALVDHCSGLPLALGIAAARVAENPDFPLSSLVSELHDERERLDALDMGGETGVRAVFSWSYRSLSPEAARLFRLLGLPNGPDISLAAVADLVGIPQRAAKNQLAELTRAHLLDQHQPNRFQFHDLLRAYAAECAAQDEPPEDRQAALRRLFDHYLRTSLGIDRRFVAHSRPFVPELPESEITGLAFDDEGGLAWWDVERANVLAAMRQAFQLGFHGHAWQLPYTLMYFFRLRGYTEDWITSYELALESVREVGNREGEARLLFEYGIVHYGLGKYDITLSHQEQALSLFEELGDRPATAALLCSLGEVYIKLERSDDAMTSLQRGLNLYREQADLYGQGFAHTGFGQLHVQLADFDQARTHFQEGLRFYREGSEKYGEHFIQHHLAEIDLRSGELENAIATYRRAVAGRREIGHRQGEAESLRGLGVALRAAGDVDGARESWQRALALFEELGDPEAEELQVELNGLPG